MSLDVYLESECDNERAPSSGIFIRRDGETVEIPAEEWDRLHPGRYPVAYRSETSVTREVYSRNITHNVAEMADKAGLYSFVWRPDEYGIERARQLIEPLADGLNKLVSSPDEFTPLNPPNGWGSYDGLVRFVADYLNACIKHPDAKVRVWR